LQWSKIQRAIFAKVGFKKEKKRIKERKIKRGEREREKERKEKRGVKRK